MIIFKAKYERAWEISEMQIVCTSKMDEWDFEIVGNYEDNIPRYSVDVRFSTLRGYYDPPATMKMRMRRRMTQLGLGF